MKSFGIASNSRLNKKVISKAIWLLPLISPHRPTEGPSAHEGFDTLDQSSSHRRDVFEQEQAGVVSNRNPADPR